MYRITRQKTTDWRSIAGLFSSTAYGKDKKADSLRLPLGFTFKFFGIEFDSVELLPFLGILRFGEFNGWPAYVKVEKIPTKGWIDSFIAPLWADFNAFA
ncbi:MAG: hypothetical protein JW884_06245 [Deltaproteobacteria bacterium]|nr:hypothetical protein [Deltaproteobacteria bacterium]